MDNEEVMELELLQHKAIRQKNATEWVVFVHGIGGGSSIWFKQIRAFCNHFNVLLIDLPGHSGSEWGLKDLPNHSFKTIGADILKVLDHQKITNAHFVGMSLGTIIIQVIHSISPHRVKSMVLGGAVEAFNSFAKGIIRVAQPIKEHVPYMWLYRLSARILMPRRSQKESRSIFVKEAYKLGKKEFLCWFHLHSAVEPFFETIKNSMEETPTLYLMGEEDHMFLPTIRQKVSVLKHATLKVIDGAGHVVNIDSPKAFNKSSIDFLLKN